MIEGVVLWIGVVALFGLGLVGIFVPVVPGVGLVFAGILFYAWATGWETISVTWVAVFGVVALLAWVADYIGAAAGAKYGGGKWPTVLGSVIGAVAGLILGGPLGLFIGAFAGALGGALYEGQSMEKASRAALYAVIGMVGATVVQLVLAVAMILAFIIVVLV